MKKLLFISLLALFSFPLFSQSYTFPYKNVLRISPFEFSRSQFELSYERYLNNRKSSVIIAPSIYLNEGENESLNGWQLMSQYRFYLTHLSKESGNSILNIYDIAFYAGVYGLYMDITEKDLESYYDDITNQYIEQENTYDINSEEGGALIGMQVDITSRIVFDFYVGGGVRFSQVESTYNLPDLYYGDPSIFDFDFQGVKPKVGFSLGITF